MIGKWDTRRALYDKLLGEARSLLILLSSGITTAGKTCTDEEATTIREARNDRPPAPRQGLTVSCGTPTDFVV